MLGEETLPTHTTQWRRKANGNHCVSTHGFVEHTSLPVLVLACGTVHKAVAQDVIVDAMISAHPVRSRASDSFHAVFGDWTFYK